MAVEITSSSARTLGAQRAADFRIIVLKGCLLKNPFHPAEWKSLLEKRLFRAGRSMNGFQVEWHASPH
jgi:hypothetical protein